MKRCENRQEYLRKPPFSLGLPIRIAPWASANPCEHPVAWRMVEQLHPSVQRPTSRMRKFSLIVSLLLFAGSLALPIARGPQLTGYYPGGLALLIGWIALMGAATSPAFCGLSWLANPAYLIALLTGRRPRLQRAAAFSTLGFASLFLGIDKLPLNEAGDMAQVTGMGPGYLLWLGALVALNVFTWSLPRTRK